MTGRPYLDVDPANTAGRATALTAITQLKWWGRWWLPVAFWLGRNVRSSGRKLEELSFIQAASWHLVRRLPRERSLPRRERLRDLLVFQSNFNDSWSGYIDAFSFAVPTRMRMAWDSSLGFPGPRPTGPFRDYIWRNDLRCDHYYCAYPEGTASTTTAALAVARDFAALVDRWATDGSDAGCARAWQRFLTDVQLHL